MTSPGRYILIMAATILWACTSGHTEEEKIVAEWLGKKIVLPEYITDAMTGDSVNLAEADFTILNYIDSAGCTGCKLRLPMWNEFISSLDTITDYDVNIIMIAGSPNEDEIKYLLKRDGYRYPVFIDPKDEICRANTFPADYRFQSFLLDRSHHVIAVGSPVYLPSIAALYRSVLSGERTVSIARRLDISVSGADPYIGNVKPETEIERLYRLNNNSEDTVYISKILSSCDCISATASQENIAPHASADISVTLTADSVAGPMSRSVNIYYRGVDTPSIITLKCNITS